MDTPLPHPLVQTFPHGDLPRNVLAFCERLRSKGFTIGPQEVSDALCAAEAVGIANRTKFRTALKLVLCTRLEDAAQFDTMFYAFFLDKRLERKGSARDAEPNEEVGEEAAEQEDSGQGDSDEEVGRESQRETASVDVQEGNGEGEQGHNPLLRAWFSYAAAQTETPVTLPQKDMDKMLAAAKHLATRLRLGKSRRWRSSKYGRRFDVRRTLRHSLQTGGEAVIPLWLTHPPRKPRFVLLLDGSRSMAAHSGVLLQFAQALTKRTSRVEVFVFSTHLRRISPELRQALKQEDSLQNLGEAWGGGTRLGESLETFARQHSARLTKDTLVMIASDGLDTANDQTPLERAMRELHRRAAGVVWLNPLLATEGYAPTARGMVSALPYIDTLATAQDAASFKALAAKIRLRR